MNVGKTLFAQLMEFIPWTSFTRIVNRYSGNSGVRRLSCAEQFRVMAFAQLTWRESLRDIEVTLGANSSKLYAIGLRHVVRRSTLADANDNNLVLSRRDLLDRERQESAGKTWSELAEGQVRDGTVRSLQDYGAFVDIGGVDGLIPLREMAWARIKHPSEILKVGDSVKVKVLKIDPETKKISLGLRQLTDNPWDAAAAKLVPGTTVSGTVSKLTDFGAFVSLEGGIEGLVHLSELSTKRVRRPQDAVKAGEAVEVVVLSIDNDLKRVALSIKAAKMAAEQANLSKTRFLAAASHDLLQPLNAARLFVSALAGRRLAEGNRKIEGSAALAQIGRCEVHGDAPRRPGVAGRSNR